MVPALGKLRQEDCLKSPVGLGYAVNFRSVNTSKTRAAPYNQSAVE